MPHLTIEYSSNLEKRVDFGRFCTELLNAALATGLFEIGAVRVRAVCCDHYAIADRHAKNSFIDMSFRIGQGRSAKDKRRAGDAIFAAAETFVAPLFETPHFALSLEIREIDREMSWKNNAIHSRLRVKPEGA